MLSSIWKGIRINTEWLHCLLFEYKLLYVDLWSVIHFLSGMLILLILAAEGKKRIFRTLLIILASFEIVEVTFFIGVLKLFMPEKTLDIFNDIAIGMLGGYLIYIVIMWRKSDVYAKWIFAILCSIFVSFTWVGWYGYSYNKSFFNSACLNWWAFICWTLAGFAIIMLNYYCEKKFNFIKALAITLLVYVFLLFVVEYLAYNIFSLREISGKGNALVLDIIHGSKIMHIYYFIAPLFYLLVFKVSNYYLEKHEKRKLAIS